MTEHKRTTEFKKMKINHYMLVIKERQGTQISKQFETHNVNPLTNSNNIIGFIKEHVTEESGQYMTILALNKDKYPLAIQTYPAGKVNIDRSKLSINERIKMITDMLSIKVSYYQFVHYNIDTDNIHIMPKEHAKNTHIMYPNQP